jgi:hypothetical protein
MPGYGKSVWQSKTSKGPTVRLSQDCSKQRLPWVEIDEGIDRTVGSVETAEASVDTDT